MNTQTNKSSWRLNANRPIYSWFILSLLSFVGLFLSTSVPANLIEKLSPLSQAKLALAYYLNLNLWSAVFFSLTHFLFTKEKWESLKVGVVMSPAPCFVWAVWQFVRPLLSDQTAYFVLTICVCALLSVVIIKEAILEKEKESGWGWNAMMSTALFLVLLCTPITTTLLVAILF